MGIILFLIVTIVETTFAVFCIITKSNHVKVKSIIRILSFVVFVFFTIISVFQWSFRYYAIGYLLAFLAIIGCYNLIKGKRYIVEYKAVRTLSRTIVVILLVFLTSLPAILFPQNIISIKPTGNDQVVTYKTTYVDENRNEDYSKSVKNRELNIQFWYPDNESKTYPLIVFSHGGLGVKSSNESLYNELASHGYIVLSIDHTYQSFFTTNEDGKTTWINYGYLQQMLNENPLKDIKQSFSYYQQWMEIRVADINFVLDTTISKAKELSANKPFELIDFEKIGVMGHSLGGSAALAIGRIRDDVNAVIALESPFMYDIEGINDQGFVFNHDTYPLPVLNVYSDSSWGILDKRPQYAQNYALLSGTHEDVYNAHIKGIGHLALTDFSLTSPILTRLFDGQKASIEPEAALLLVNQLCLDFFNKYLSNGEIDLGE